MVREAWIKGCSREATKVDPQERIIHQNSIQLTLDPAGPSTTIGPSGRIPCCGKILQTTGINAAVETLHRRKARPITISLL